MVSPRSEVYLIHEYILFNQTILFTVTLGFHDGCIYRPWQEEPFFDNPGLEGLRLRYLQGAAAEPVSSSEVSPGIPESVYQGICIPYTLYRVLYIYMLGECILD